MKKKMFKIAVLLLTAVCGYSQVSWNVKAGMNVSKITNYHADSDMKPGYQFGVGMDYFFTDSWGIQPSLMLVNKGVKIKRSINFEEMPDGYSSASPSVSFPYLPYNNLTENRMYLEMPVMLAYRVDLSNTLKLVFNGGGYIGYGIGGKTSVTYDNQDGSVEKHKGNTFDRSGSQRFDYGLGVGTALELKNRYTVNLFGEWGLTSAGTNIMTYHRKNANQTYGINIGYKF